ncbi:hypothetical protein ONS96_003210 [Cadophora gregata f. sp. sojae]|nr:hypothetical protein ONS96_003210 [Cadophora gregata f. sp. sojae]
MGGGSARDLDVEVDFVGADAAWNLEEHLKVVLWAGEQLRARTRSSILLAPIWKSRIQSDRPARVIHDPKTADDKTYKRYTLVIFLMPKKTWSRRVSDRRYSEADRWGFHHASYWKEFPGKSSISPIPKSSGVFEGCWSPLQGAIYQISERQISTAHFADGMWAGDAAMVAALWRSP